MGQPKRSEGADLDVPKLLAHLVVVASEGLTGQDALDRLNALMKDEPQKPQLRHSRAIDYDIYNSQLRHEAWKAWMHEDD